MFYRRIRNFEVEIVLKTMKSNKALGPDNIPIEAWKCLGKKRVAWLTSSNNGNIREVKIENQELLKGEYFSYIGSIITAVREIEADVIHRIKAGWFNWRSASGVLSNKRVSTRLKGKFYRIVIRLVMLYGTELPRPCFIKVASPRLMGVDVPWVHLMPQCAFDYTDLRELKHHKICLPAKCYCSEKHKQDLLAEIVLEEQRGRELSKIVKELLPDPKSSTIVDKPSRARKSNDRNKVSKRLTEEAEKYFEDFISNVEDTDISSFDGERSDASSTLGVTKTRDAVSHSRETETFHSTAGSNSLPVEMDGVILPWLQWETTNDGSPLPSKNKRELPVTPKSILWDANQGEISAHDPSCHSTSSQWSWSPGMDCSSLSTREGTGSIPKELGSHQRSEFDMAKYLKLEKEEDLLFERWREQNRINRGGLLLCSNAFI
ncbi:hypothetical protein CsSME_00053081 [Camellia sinensis var. sinensis]